MRVALFGDDTRSIKPLVIEAGFKVVTKNPDIVLSYGGDGTFLRSEHKYPKIPKLLIKNSSTCTLCTELPLDEVLARISLNDYTVHEAIKLRVEAKGKKRYALNDIVIHNTDPRHAIRFNVAVGHHEIKDAIGDGVVVATVLGSTGYYKSITKKSFSSGVGIAFNNTSRQIDPIVLNEENFHVSVSITRGPALMYADNQKNELILKTGETANVSVSKKPAKVLIFD